MDQIKLNMWQERFQERLTQLEADYQSYQLPTPLSTAYSVSLDESNEWEIKISDGIPDDFVKRIEQAFWGSKPEDSI